MEQEQIEKMRIEWAVSGQSIRSLAIKYGISASRAFRIMSEKKGKKKAQSVQQITEVQSEVAKLREQLRKERLKNELLNNIIDIADKELGTNIRKKSGTKQSE